MDEWYNAVQAQVNLAKYPPEMAKILHRDIFWFFMRDEDFVTKTINEGNVDIQKFPASKVHQLVKKMESSKATGKHIRQVAGDLPAAQVQLMQHQCTQLPAGNYPRRKQNSTSGQKPQNHKTPKVPTFWKLSDMQRPDADPNTCKRLSMSSQKIPMQDMPQVWSLHNSVLPKKSRSTLIKFISSKETKSTTTSCGGPIHPP